MRRDTRTRNPGPVANWVRANRQRRGLKIGELATRVGSSRGHLHNVESGWRKPSIELLHRIAEELGIPHEEIPELDKAKDAAA